MKAITSFLFALFVAASAAQAEINIRQITSVSPKSPLNKGDDTGAAWSGWLETAFKAVYNDPKNHGGDSQTNTEAFVAHEGLAEYSDILIGDWGDGHYIWKGQYTTNIADFGAEDGNEIRFMVIVTASNETFRQSDIKFHYWSNEGSFDSSGDLGDFDLSTSVVMRITDFGSDGTLGGTDDVRTTSLSANLIGFVYVGVGIRFNLDQSGFSPGTNSVQEGIDYLRETGFRLYSDVWVGTNISRSGVQLVDSVDFPSSSPYIFGGTVDDEETHGAFVDIPTLPGVEYSAYLEQVLDNSPFDFHLETFTGDGDFHTILIPHPRNQVAHELLNVSRAPISLGAPLDD